MNEISTHTPTVDPAIPAELVELLDAFDTRVSASAPQEEAPTIVGRWLTAQAAWRTAATYWREMWTQMAWLDMTLLATDWLVMAALWDARMPYAGAINRHFKYEEVLLLLDRQPSHRLSQSRIEEAALCLYRARVETPGLDHVGERSAVLIGLQGQGLLPLFGHGQGEMHE